LRGKDLKTNFNHKDHIDRKEKSFLVALCALCALCGKTIPGVVLFGKGVPIPVFVCVKWAGRVKDKVALARRLRQERTISLNSVAKRLNMGAAGSLAMRLRDARRKRKYSIIRV
jgi:hypothetical protein